MHDRIAVVCDGTETAWVAELTVEGAGALVAQLVAAIREARAAEMTA